MSEVAREPSPEFVERYSAFFDEFHEGLRTLPDTMPLARDFASLMSVAVSEEHVPFDMDQFELAKILFRTIGELEHRIALLEAKLDEK